MEAAPAVLPAGRHQHQLSVQEQMLLRLTVVEIIEIETEQKLLDVGEPHGIYLIHLHLLQRTVIVQLEFPTHVLLQEQLVPDQVEVGA